MTVTRQWTDLVPGALPVAVAVVRFDDGVVLYGNATLATLLADPIEVPGPTLDALLGVPGAAARARDAVQDGTGIVELSIDRAGGQSVDLEVLVRAAEHEGGTVLVAAFHDVSERRRVEGQLADVARFPNMNPGPVLRMDNEGTIVLVNRAAQNAFGGLALVGSRWLDVCPGMTPALWRSLLTSNERIQHEAEVEDAVYMFTHVGEPETETIFVFGADITARRRAESELVELARFPDMNPGPVLRMDLAATVLLANRAARAVFGNEMVGRRWTDLYPASRDRWEEILSADEVVLVEARISERDYVFEHRMDPRTSLVFVYGHDVSEQRLAEHALRQSEKMATLGTLAAGVAHELNNPAAATTRAAGHLHEALGRLDETRLRLDGVATTEEARTLLTDIERGAREHAVLHRSIDPVTRSDQENELEDWLDEHGIDEPWTVAPALVDQDLTVEELDSIAATMGEGGVAPVLEWAAAAYEVHRLTHEVGEGSKRISETVKALKSYSYLGQAPVAQAINLHEDLDNTLVILRHKLRQGVTVTRNYAEDLPPVPAYGSELNQVWTNLLDNAIDAMGGEGEITVRTHRAGGFAVVEISDDGPGIPAGVTQRIFDPFFTTKGVGKGTGLGLSTSYTIVTEKHGGSITVESAPGRTTFTVRLPLDHVLTPASGGTPRHA